jgi:hypothetical protein
MLVFFAPLSCIHLLTRKWKVGVDCDATPHAAGLNGNHDDLISCLVLRKSVIAILRPERVVSASEPSVVSYFHNYRHFYVSLSLIP